MMKWNTSSFTHSQCLHDSHLDQRLWSKPPSRTQSLTTPGPFVGKTGWLGARVLPGHPSGEAGSLSPTSGEGYG